MAVFECKKHPELTIYVSKDKKVQFRRGKLETKDPRVIAALKKVSYVRRIDVKEKPVETKEPEQKEQITEKKGKSIKSKKK